MMPLDPFFTSANTRHFIPDEGATLLYNWLKSMPTEQRREVMLSWRTQKEPLSKEQWIVRRRFGYELTHKRRALVHRTSQKNIAKAIKELTQGKRFMVKMVQGYGTTAGAGGRTTKRAKKSV